MGLIDALRKAEQRGKNVLQKSIASVSPDDAQRDSRRRMRIYPQNAATLKTRKPEGHNIEDVPAEGSEIEGRRIA